MGCRAHLRTWMVWPFPFLAANATPLLLCTLLMGRCASMLTAAKVHCNALSCAGLSLGAHVFMSTRAWSHAHSGGFQNGGLSLGTMLRHHLGPIVYLIQL